MFKISLTVDGQKKIKVFPNKKLSSMKFFLDEVFSNKVFSNVQHNSYNLLFHLNDVGTNMFLLVKYGKIYSFKQDNYCVTLADKFSAVCKGNMTSDQCTV